MIGLSLSVDSRAKLYWNWFRNLGTFPQMRATNRESGSAILWASHFSLLEISHTTVCRNPQPQLSPTRRGANGNWGRILIWRPTILYLTLIFPNVISKKTVVSRENSTRLAMLVACRALSCLVLLTRHITHRIRLGSKVDRGCISNGYCSLLGRSWIHLIMSYINEKLGK